MPPFQPALISRLKQSHVSPAVASESRPPDSEDTPQRLSLPQSTRPASLSSSSDRPVPGNKSPSTSAFAHASGLDSIGVTSTASPSSAEVSGEPARSYASSAQASIDTPDSRSTALDFLRSVSKKTTQADDLATVRRGMKGRNARRRREAPLFPSLAIDQQDQLSHGTDVEDFGQQVEAQPEEPESITPHDALEVRVERCYYVMTAAGKPVYISPPLVSPPWPSTSQETRPLAGIHTTGRIEDDESDDASEKVTTRIGVLAALSAIYAAGGDRLHSLSMEGGNITFLTRGQLLLVCVTRLARHTQHKAEEPLEQDCYSDPEVVTRGHLEALHVQIQSLLSPAALGALFKRSAGADPGRLLGGSGTARILASALQQAHEDRALLTGAIQPARLPLNCRDQLGTLLRPADSGLGDLAAARSKNLLYAMLLHRRQILQIARPRRHSAHPTDIVALLNTIYATARPEELDAEHFIPLSLPKFAPQGFVYVYSATIRLNALRTTPSSRHRAARSVSSSIPNSPDTSTYSPPVPPQSVPSSPSPTSAPTPARDTHTHITLCFVSADREALPLLQEWRAEIEHTIRRPPLYNRLLSALPRSSYTASQVPVKGLQHFLYKSRVNAQATGPTWAPGQPYRPGSVAHTRLNRLYDQAYDALHGPLHRSPPDGGGDDGERSETTVKVPTLVAVPLKMHYISTVHEVVLAWLTQPFELYLTLPSGASKQDALVAANAIARWVKKHETGLFLLSPPVF